VNDAILGWLRTRPDRPFFIWMHYWDPHEPHIAPAPFSQLHAHDPYQGEIAYADDALGAMLRKLDELGELDRTLVIMTSDHGEGRGEHNEATHAFLAHETTLHVPLIMQVPGLGAGRRVVENVGTVDIVPTVLDYLGFEIPERVQGRSLVALINQEPGYQLLADEPYYAESMSPRLSHGFGDLRVLYDREQKLIYGPRPELYDLSVDPHELREISGQRPDQMSALKDRLEVVIDRYAGELSARQEFDEERLQRLAGLGYLNMTGGDVSVIEELRDDGGAPQDHVENINRVFQLRGLMGSGSFRLAALLAEELLANDPDNGYVQAQLALAHVGLGDTEAAVKVVRGSLPASAANINAFAHAAVAWAKAGETEAAAQLMHELLAGQNSAPALMALAQIQALDGNVGGRIESLSQAVHLKPDDRNSRLQLAFALLDEGRLTDAEGHLTTLVERAPGDARAHFGLSRVYWGSDLPERALERISRAVLLDPADCEALKSRIEWLVALGHDDEAASAQAGLPHACQDHQAGLP
jgi:tetratricopeptide (TPR) repeat protein